MARLFERQPTALERLFSSRELADVGRDGAGVDSTVAIRRLAARFAAKEAAFKALGGEGGLGDSLEVWTNNDGSPELRIRGQALPHVSISLSHDGDYALAYVVAERTLSRPRDDGHSVLEKAGHAKPGDPDGLRERAVRVVHQHEYDSQWEAMCSVAEKLGPHAETVHSCARQAGTDQERRPLVTDEQAELKRLKQENKRLKQENAELRRANDLLKTEAGSFGATLEPPSRK